MEPDPTKREGKFWSNDQVGEVVQTCANHTPNYYLWGVRYKCIEPGVFLVVGSGTTGGGVGERNDLTLPSATVRQCFQLQSDVDHTCPKTRAFPLSLTPVQFMA